MDWKLGGLILFVLLTGCNQVDEIKSYEDQRQDIANVVKGKMVGSSPDVWLTKNLNDQVALIFGYMDDYGTCLELAELYMQRYPADKYHCTIAN